MLIPDALNRASRWSGRRWGIARVRRSLIFGFMNAELNYWNRDAALRELIEETGYGGDGEGAGKATVEEVSPLLVRISGVFLIRLLNMLRYS